jgi:hypothetical protein
VCTFSMSRGMFGGRTAVEQGPWLSDASRTLCHHSSPSSLFESQFAPHAVHLQVARPPSPFLPSPLLLYPATVPRRIHPWGCSSHGVSHPSINLLPPPPRPLLPPAMQSSHQTSSIDTCQQQSGSSSATVVDPVFGPLSTIALL